MRKLVSLLGVFLMLLLAAGCGQSDASQAKTTATVEAAKPAVDNSDTVKNKKILVAYFSRTGENYQVGYIKKGNTNIVADMIAEELGAETFEIKTVKTYPEDYRECTEVAAAEKEADARPELATKVANMQDYDVIFLGYPIWWSDMPMAVYTFLESYDFKGKTIIPFATAASDNMTGKEHAIPSYAKGAKLIDNGLGIKGKRVQENPDSVRPEVKAWLTKLGYEK